LRLKKRDWGFIAVAGAVVGLLAVLSLIGKKAEPMSAGPYHAGMTAATKRVECLVCHDPARPGASIPLPDTHPLVWKKEEVSCITCHAPPERTAWRPALEPNAPSTAHAHATTKEGHAR
jgi:hypothetical protein